MLCVYCGTYELSIVWSDVSGSSVWGVRVSLLYVHGMPPVLLNSPTPQYVLHIIHTTSVHCVLHKV